MKTMTRFFPLVLLTSVFLVHCTQAPSTMEEAAIGSAAPAFQLADLTGREISLSRFKGKVVILDFWATWCGPCRMSMPLLEQLQKEYPERLKLLAINLEEPLDMVRDYVSRQNIRSTVLLDAEGTVGRTYRIVSIPMQVVIDKKGILRHYHVGFSPRMTEQLKSEIDKLSAD